MNYNISNNFNAAQFFTSKPLNSTMRAPTVLQCISTALKFSLSVYQIQWKMTELSSETTIFTQTSVGTISQSFKTDKRTPQEKHLNLIQQNKKSIEKLSYNQEIFKKKLNQNDTILNPDNTLDKNCLQQNKETIQPSQELQTRRQKIIHQRKNKGLTSHIKKGYKQENLIVDLYEPAYIRNKQISLDQIRQKREKLQLRRVLNWREVDKKNGFRKMQLKKLLS